MIVGVVAYVSDEAARVLHVPGSGRQSVDALAPVAVEKVNEQFAQILAEHGREGDGGRGALAVPDEAYVDGPALELHQVIGSLAALGYYVNPSAESVLKYAGIKVSAAELVAGEEHLAFGRLKKLS